MNNNNNTQQVKIELLQPQFRGVGEVRGFLFNLIKRTPDLALYEVKTEDEFGKVVDTHYEVIKVKKVARCIDFDNRIFDQNDLKEVYPKSNDFGKTAWSAFTLCSALKRYNELIKKAKKNESKYN